MADEMNQLSRIYKNILGDTKETIDAIQKFIQENSEPTHKKKEDDDIESSINRVLNSVICEETTAEIEKIIKNL